MAVTSVGGAPFLVAVITEPLFSTKRHFFGGALDEGWFGFTGVRVGKWVRG